MSIYKKIDLQNRLVSALQAQIAAAERSDLRDELRADLNAALEELYYLEELAEDAADLEDY
jgi:hypothetical protein